MIGGGEAVEPSMLRVALAGADSDMGGTRGGVVMKRVSGRAGG
ncbi:hypothetical protein SAMN05443572_110206 [Myxococcus fulvus]|uniref:Uncharacterized protein n=1 Tax=Myxococcus fulvus TaxID=33 RepID=A0ABY1CS03_MYXFU|nr:hypothetical protein SAMN05443572_110206 [Myxococcus fulvus]